MMMDIEFALLVLASCILDSKSQCYSIILRSLTGRARAGLWILVYLCIPLDTNMARLDMGAYRVSTSAAQHLAPRYL